MAQHKVKKCTYRVGNSGDKLAHNFVVSGNTESAVLQHLQKLFNNHEIVINEIVWG